MNYNFSLKHHLLCFFMVLILLIPPSISLAQSFEKILGMKVDELVAIYPKTYVMCWPEKNIDYKCCMSGNNIMLQMRGFYYKEARKPVMADLIFSENILSRVFIEVYDKYSRAPAREVLNKYWELIGVFEELYPGTSTVKGTYHISWQTKAVTVDLALDPGTWSLYVIYTSNRYFKPFKSCDSEQALEEAPESRLPGPRDLPQTWKYDIGISQKGHSPDDGNLKEIGKKKKVKKEENNNMDYRDGRSVRVVRVIDGNTITIDTVERVRLLGVIVPAINHPTNGKQCFAEEAKKFVKMKIEGKKVLLTYEGMRRDNNGRLLAWVWYGVDSLQLLNRDIIAEGYGFSDKKYPTSRLDEFNKLEQQAKEKQKGLWHPDNCNYQEGGTD